MPEARAAEASPAVGPASEQPSEKTDPALTSGESHECVFAELCTTTPPVIRLAPAQIIGLPTQFHAVTWPPYPLPPLVDRAPPVPPPKL